MKIPDRPAARPEWRRAPVPDTRYCLKNRPPGDRIRIAAFAGPDTPANCLLRASPPGGTI